MTLELMQDIASRYLERFKDYGVSVSQDRHTEESAMAYANYMCCRIKEMAREGDESKANRWLGFVQGIYWSFGMYSINNMRDHNAGRKLP